MIFATVGCYVSAVATIWAVFFNRRAVPLFAFFIFLFLGIMQYVHQ